MIKTISPIDGSLYYSAEEHNLNDISKSLDLAEKALPVWSDMTIQQRATYVKKFIEVIVANTEDIAREITWQMGRPISQSPWEISGFSERANYMVDIAEEALQ